MACSDLISTTEMETAKLEAAGLSEFVESVNSTFTTPAGKVKKTISGIIAESESAIDTIEQEALSRARRSTPLSFNSGQYSYTFPGFNASMSSYDVYSDSSVFPNQTLISGIDYTFTDETTSTITLASSWETGFIIARSLDPTGTGIVSTGNSFTKADLIAAVGFVGDEEVVVPELGSARYVLSNSATALTGDITLNSGLVAVLKPDSNDGWNVRAFGATGDGTTDDRQSFIDAADRAFEYTNKIGQCMVNVPFGGYYMNDYVGKECVYNMAVGAVMTGAGPVSPTGVNDARWLKDGTIIRMEGSRQFTTLYVGEADYGVQAARGRGVVSEIVGTSATGNGGITGATHSALSNVENQSCIGVTAIAINDNSTVDRTVWSLYTEAVKNADAGGNTFAHENAIVNKATTVTIHPNQIPLYGDGITCGEWCSVGIGEADDLNASAYKATLAINKNVAQYAKGWVVYDGAIATGTNYNETCAWAHNSAVVWYPEATVANPGISCAWMKGIGEGGLGVISFNVRNSANASTFKAWNVNLSAFTPTENNVSDLAGATTRVKTIYAVNSLDVSSDETLKELRDTDGELTTAEINAAIKIARLPKVFQWINEITVKAGTDDTVYLHCSPMAQKVWAALESEGLDPSLYGFVNDGGDDSTMSLQPQELLWMICSAQQTKIDNIETRLNALEA